MNVLVSLFVYKCPSYLLAFIQQAVTPLKTNGRIETLKSLNEGLSVKHKQHLFPYRAVLQNIHTVVHRLRLYICYLGKLLYTLLDLTPLSLCAYLSSGSLIHIFLKIWFTKDLVRVHKIL